MRRDQSFVFRLLRRINIIALRPLCLTCPVTYLTYISSSKRVLIIKARRRLNRRASFIAIFTLNFRLMKGYDTRILRAFTILPTIRRCFIRRGRRLPYPVKVRLTTRILINIRHRIILRGNFRRIRRHTFTHIPFFKRRRRSEGFLGEVGMRRLRMIRTRLMLFSRSVLRWQTSTKRATLLQSISCQLVRVRRLSSGKLMTRVIKSNARAIVLQRNDRTIFTMILPRNLKIPYSTFLRATPIGRQLIGGLMRNDSRASRFILFCREFYLILYHQRRYQRQIGRSNTGL